MHLAKLEEIVDQKKKIPYGKIEYIKPVFKKEKENVLLYPKKFMILTTIHGNYFLGSKIKEYKLIYTLEGEGKIQYNGMEHILTKGKGCFINCQNSYSCTTTSKEWKHTVLTLSGEMASIFCREYEKTGILFSDDEFPDFKERQYYIVKKFRTEGKLSGFDMSCHLDHLLTKLLLSTKNKKRKNEAENSLIMKVISYMQDNFQKNIEIQKLAEHFNFSPSYFRKLFREKMAVSPKEYLSQLRINYAKEQLKKTEKSISVISQEAGFQSPEYFSQVFKQTTGQTATEYRKLNSEFACSN